MKLVDGVILSEVDGQYYAVDDGEGRKRFNGIIKLNKSGAYVARQLQTEKTLDEIVQAMMENYGITADVARENALRIVEGFRSVGLLS